jgi:diaminopimelate epimerase
MKSVHFTKAEGAQNDFVIIDDRQGRMPEQQRREFTRRISHRRKGAGSDGVIFIERSDEADFTMTFYNPDGSTGSMCGNGGRCAALYALRRGIAPAQMRFEVLGRTYHAEVHAGGVRLYFPPPFDVQLGVTVEAGGHQWSGHFIHTGAPHFLLFTDQQPAFEGTPFDAIRLEEVAPALRRHPHFLPDGANINILQVKERGEIFIRTFEKGVEAETEACGTGTLAAALAAHAVHGITPPLSLFTHGGDMLEVGFTPPADAVDLYTPSYFSCDLYLQGPANLVYEGCCIL